MGKNTILQVQNGQLGVQATGIGGNRGKVGE